MITLLKYGSLIYGEKFEVVELEANLPDAIAYQIAAHVLACWEQTGKTGLLEEKDCYEIILKCIIRKKYRSHENRILYPT